VDIYPQRFAADISYPFCFLMGVVVKARGVLYQQDGFLRLRHAPHRLFPMRPEDFFPIHVFVAQHPINGFGLSPVPAAKPD
jgi:hypothetical protein